MQGAFLLELSDDGGATSDDTAKTHLSALLDEVARGETIIITERGRPVARLTAPEAPDREAAAAAAKALRNLRTGQGTRLDRV